MPGDPEECRERAKHCQEMADAASSTDAKELFENLAETWKRIANDNAHTKALLENWFES